jgi:hypothetical protein
MNLRTPKALVTFTLLAMSFVSVYVLAQNRYGQANRSVIAPRQELVKSVVNEAYAKFKNIPPERMPITYLISPK